MGITLRMKEEGDSNDDSRVSQMTHTDEGDNDHDSDGDSESDTGHGNEGDSNRDSENSEDTE